MRPARNSPVILAAGGTGGHVFSAQALSEELLSRGWPIWLWTDSRGERYTRGFPAEVKIRRTTSGTFGRDRWLDRIGAPARVACGILAALTSFVLNRPSAVVGFGGYPAFPPLFAAALLGLPCLIHEQNAVMGRANKVLAKRMDAVASGQKSMHTLKGVSATFVGNPVRKEVFAATTRYTPPGTGKLRLVVIGGSQGARTVALTAARALERLPPDLLSRVHLSIQAPADTAETVGGILERIGVDADVRTFFDDIPHRLAACHLVVSRSGATATAEIAAVGRPSILIPLASAVNDHQAANADAFVKAGAAVSLREDQCGPEELARSICAILNDGGKAAEMARSASELNTRDAAGELASLVEQVVKENG